MGQVKDKLWNELNEIPDTTDCGGGTKHKFGSLESLEELVERHRAFFPETYFNELQGTDDETR